MSISNIFKAIASKKIDNLKGVFKKDKRSDPVDKKLPFDLHIGSSISFDQTPFIVYGDKIKISSPGKESVVAAYGKTELNDSLIHRFYLYDSEDKENTSLLQIVSSADNLQIQECKLFKSEDEVFPEDKEEWGFWLDDNEGYIGWHTFQDKFENTYHRVWGEEDAERCDPVCFSETVYFDKYKENFSKINHTAMLYGRWIDEEQDMGELILLSAEESDADSALVHIYIGIDVMPESFKVNY